MKYSKKRDMNRFEGFKCSYGKIGENKMGR